MTEVKYSKIGLIKKTYGNIGPFIRKKNARSYFTLTLTLFCLSFFGFFAVRPTLVTAVSLVKSIQDLKNLNVGYDNKLSSFIQTQTEYEKIRPGVQLIKEALPEESSFHKLIPSMEKIASESAVQISSFQVGATSISLEPPENKYKKYGFSMTITGEYDSVYSFIKKIINWKWLVKIDSLNIDTASDQEGLLKLNISASCYYEP